MTFLHTRVSDCEICTGSNNYKQPGVSKISRTDHRVIMDCISRLLPDLWLRLKRSVQCLIRNQDEILSKLLFKMFSLYQKAEVTLVVETSTFS